jgi:hypothetical protein
LEPPAEVRHVAFDHAGNIYVLGVDAADFKKQSGQCRLVHKYDAAGTKITAFSKAPTQYSQVKEEVDQGLLWSTRGRVGHVLPFARVLRHFDSTTGDVIREIEFTRPDSGYPAQLRLLVPAAHNKYVIVWLYSQQSPGSRQNVQVVALHDSDGNPIGRTNPLTREDGAPLFADESGAVYILRNAAPTQYELAKVAIDIE